MSVGVIGAGNWGKNLIHTFFRLGELSGVAEINPKTREELAQAYPGIPIYDDYRCLLESNIPAVAIATPVPTHYVLAKEALAAGKDVFVEKPMALSKAEAQELVEIAEKHNRVLMAGHLLLYQPAIRWIKEFVESGALGKVAFLTQERLKFGRVRAVESVLWSFGVHDVAVLLYLVGQKPQEVRATGQRFLQEKVEDDVYVHMKFPGGVQAHLHVSWLWPETRRCLIIAGSEGMLTYNELEQKVTLHRKRVAPGLEHLDEGSEVVFRGREEPLLLECRHFLECVVRRENPLSGGRSAVEVTEVLEIADKQLREERT